MKRAALFSYFLIALFGLVCFNVNGRELKVRAATKTIDLATDISETLAFDLSVGSDVNFGSLVAGSPIAGPLTGSVASVTTNAANGYTLALSDGVAGTDSSLSNGNFNIPDYAGTIGTPTVWSGVGLGITMYAADTNKEAAWGTGTTYDDANNKYAGIPELPTVAHTVTSYHSGVDTSSWAFKIDVAPDQETGAYTGTVTFSVTPVLL